jgi:hypothetical protein
LAPVELVDFAFVRDVLFAIVPRKLDSLMSKHYADIIAQSTLRFGEKSTIFPPSGIDVQRGLG